MTPLASWALIGLLAIGAWYGGKLCAAFTELMSKDRK